MKPIRNSNYKEYLNQSKNKILNERKIIGTNLNRSYTFKWTLTSSYTLVNSSTFFSHSPNDRCSSCFFPNSTYYDWQTWCFIFVWKIHQNFEIKTISAVWIFLDISNGFEPIHRSSGDKATMTQHQTRHATPYACYPFENELVQSLNRTMSGQNGFSLFWYFHFLARRLSRNDL